METIDFTYVEQGKARTLQITVSEGRIVARPVIELLGLHVPRTVKLLTDQYGGQPVKVGRVKPIGLLPAEFDRWLRSAADVMSEVHRHLVDNLVPTITRKSLDLVAVKAVEQKQAEADKTKVILVHAKATGGDDEFRRQVTRGGAANMLHPAIIAGAVARGYIDTYEVIEDIWEGGRFISHVQKKIDVNSNFTMFNKRRAKGDLMLGPDMLEKHPDNPLMKRHVVPAQPFAVPERNADFTKGKIVIVPAHEAKFAWERDLESVPVPGEKKT